MQSDRAAIAIGRGVLQGYFAHKRHPPPENLQQDYAQGHMAILGGGGCFLWARYPCTLTRQLLHVALPRSPEAVLKRTWGGAPVDERAWAT